MYLKLAVLPQGTFGHMGRCHWAELLQLEHRTTTDLKNRKKWPPILVSDQNFTFYRLLTKAFT